MRRWVCGVTALVAICASGCASPSAVSTPPPAATTSNPASAPGGGSYAGVHWIATQVSVNSVTPSIPTAMAVTVDFLQSGSVVFSDGVNAVHASWASLSGEAVRLGEVRSSAVGYVGHDARQLAAILAVRQITSPSVANHSAAEITATRGSGDLTLAGNGVQISYRSAGPTAPELTRSAPATTDAPGRTPAAGPAATSSAARDAELRKPYDLLTHCGVREALIDNNYYVASPVLDDGNGNPPTGWGNPYDSGTITINADNTADFRDSAGHRAHFVLRPGATTWLQLCS